MSESKIETTKGFCVVALTKYLMEVYGISQDEAYKKLIGMELYGLLMDEGTRLFLEPNDYLCECCRIECETGAIMSRFFHRCLDFLICGYII
ncbi:MAG: hypothetical protein ACI4R7_00540 [Oliverpabstia sp.]